MQLNPWTPVRILVIALAAGGLAACNSSQSETAKKEERRAVLVAPLTYQADARVRTLAASIRPRVEADLGFRVAGKVARRLVDAGQTVKAGTPVAMLDETDLHLQMEQAQAEVAAAKVALTQALAESRRGRELNRSGWTPQATLDKLTSAEEEARGRLERGERALDLSRNAISYATLRADTDGVVTATFIEPGQVVAAGQAAVRVARLDEKEALVALPESLVGKVADLQASLKLWTGSDKIYRAKLREISPVADPTTRTYAARFSISDADAFVALGMSATVALSQGDGASVARIPLTALFDQGFGPSVWTVQEDGALTLNPVRVARYEAQDAVIAQGPPEGDKIVVLGVQKLDPKQRVRPFTRLGN
jgi:RND family efflux transporter MFP subunit